MGYTANDAIPTLLSYLHVTMDDIQVIPETKNRGIILNIGNEQVVIFIYPLVHKQDNTKNYFDTRDSGPHERALTWNYAVANHLKYFCFGVHDKVEKFKDYIFSLECNEHVIQQLSGTENGDRSTTSRGNQIIIPNNYIPSKLFERIVNKLGTYIAVIHKDKIYDYLSFFDNRPYLLDASEINTDEIDNIDDVEQDADTGDFKRGENIILYGVPGSGKSYKIASEYCRDKQYMERVVFHPEYTYSDFIGQILPEVENDQVHYRFTPGPFTKILKKALFDSTHHYYLVIEELNRGNAPAIFGDIFQLLDREENGQGKYSIYNAEMAKYIDDGTPSVRIPANLSILATMNTSDQNVFTLDNAFQRRWKMRLIHNTFKPNNNLVHDNHISHSIAGNEVTWGTFATTINERIAMAGKEGLGSEDKRLGVFFVTDSELDNPEDFAEKVLKYLWDDAFKMDRNQVFRERFNSFEEVIDAYLGAKVTPLKVVLSEPLYNSMKSTEE